MYALVFTEMGGRCECSVACRMSRPSRSQSSTSVRVRVRVRVRVSVSVRVRVRVRVRVWVRVRQPVLDLAAPLVLRRNLNGTDRWRRCTELGRGESHAPLQPCAEAALAMHRTWPSLGEVIRRRRPAVCVGAHDRRNFGRIAGFYMHNSARVA